MDVCDIFHILYFHEYFPPLNSCGGSGWCGSSDGVNASWLDLLDPGLDVHALRWASKADAGVALRLQLLC